MKVIYPGFASDPEFVARFQREARAVARLEHPNIVHVHDFDQAEGRYFLAMQYLEGGNLKARLTGLRAEGNRLSTTEVGRILGEVAEALAYAHEQDVIHRDVKPANIMLTRDGRAVVTDFGIAKMLGATQLTQTGVGVGTPEYMSPEQGQGLALDHRTDIYSLGVVAYEMLTGRVPFTADTPVAVVLKHIRDPLPLPSALNAVVGPATERAILRALAKDPAQRYERATQFTRSLQNGLAEDERRGAATAATVLAGGRAAIPTGTAVPAAIGSRRRCRRALLAAGGTGLVVLGGATFLRSVAAPDRPSPGPLAGNSSVAATPVTAAAAPSGPPTPPPAKRGGELRVLLKGDPQQLDPAKATSAGAQLVASMLFDTLVEWGPGDQTLPGLAESWSVSADRLRWTFKLRSGAKFHHGREVRAADAKYSVERVKDPAKSSFGSNYAKIIAIDLVDEYTLALRLSDSAAPMPGALKDTIGAVIPRELEAGLGKQPVGTGPFKFGEWLAGRQLRLVANSGYWKSGLPRLDSIAFTLNSVDPVKDMLSGAADFLFEASRAEIDALRSSAFLTVDGDNVFRTYVKDFTWRSGAGLFSLRNVWLER